MGSVIRWQLVDEQPQAQLFADEDLVERHVGRGEFRGLELLHVRCKTIVNRVAGSRRMPFEYTINVYRGCSHACTYCFARPSHEYLGLDGGLDFERKLVVKVNAVERLRVELGGPRWGGHHIAMGTNTDPYQRCEGKYHLTRGVVEVLGEHANPFSILTKSTLVLRDVDVLVAAASRADVRVDLSIGTLDEGVWRATEPGTPHPRRRVEAVRRLNDSGVPCGVLMGPVLPGLSDGDDQLAEVVDACLDAGAVGVSAVALHLRPGVKEYFLEKLAETMPERVEEYHRRYARSAYLPKAEQQDLSARIRRLVDRHPRRRGKPGRTRAVNAASEDPERRGRGVEGPKPPSKSLMQTSEDADSSPAQLDLFSNRPLVRPDRTLER